MRTEQSTYQYDQPINQILFNASYEQRLTAWRNLRNSSTQDENYIQTFRRPTHCS